MPIQSYLQFKEDKPSLIQMLKKPPPFDTLFGIIDGIIQITCFSSEKPAMTFYWRERERTCEK